MSDRQSAHYILGTAGHVDHGKSAIVKALTGTDPDRLPEEKRRGITIDLGFAFLQLTSPGGGLPSSRFEIGIVDVPGHEDFVRNMVAGVGSLDAALLVVAADDGWMPQTEEHLQILTFLGVRHGVVALSKIDLADDEAAVTKAIRARLHGSPLESAPIVATSVRTGRGIEELKTTLAEMFALVPPQRDIGKPRLPVDRVFSIQGVGTVVTGTLTGGTIRRGQALVVHPHQTATHARIVQTHDHELEVGLPGSRVAINLPDLHVHIARSVRHATSIARGDTVSVLEIGKPTQVIDVAFRYLCSRTAANEPLAVKPLKNGAKVRLHHGSASVPSRIHFYDGADPGGATGLLARLSIERPLLTLAGDRFVIRDWSERRTLGGGVVLDPAPPDPAGRRPRRGSPGRVLLEERAVAPLDVSVYVASQLARNGAADRKSLLAQSLFSREEIEGAVTASLQAKSIVAAGGILIHGMVWATAREIAAVEVDNHHRSHPHHGGMPLTDLRRVLLANMGRDSAVGEKVVDAIVADLARDGFVLDGSGIRRRSHQSALPVRLLMAGQKLRQQLADRPFDPPSRKELCSTDGAHEAMKFLIAAGEAIEIGPDLVLSAPAYRQAAQMVRDHLNARGVATVSELKTLLNTSRRIMVPLVEKLDRDGVTVRDKDVRRLRPDGPKIEPA